MAVELRLIDCGSVSCSFRNNKQVEVDECYRCQWFAGVRRLEATSAVACDTVFRRPAWLPIVAALTGGRR